MQIGVVLKVVETPDCKANMKKVRSVESFK